MIVKKIPNPKMPSSKASRVGSLLDYIGAHGQSRGEKVEYRFATGDFLTDSEQGQRAEMIALASEAKRSKNPVDHWLLSWKAGEQPTGEQCQQASELLKAHLGMNSSHQAICALHRNTENYHLHIVFNRVDPLTFRVADNGWSIDYAHRAAAEIVNSQGWEHEVDALYTKVNDVCPVRERRCAPGTRALDYENLVGEKSAERIAIERVPDALRNAHSWAEVHGSLAPLGIRYEQKGSGALLWVGDVAVKASVVGREFSRKRMEERFGSFESTSYPLKQTSAEHQVQPLHESTAPEWNAYREARSQYIKNKSLAQTEQRSMQRGERENLRVRFRVERQGLHSGGSRGGNALNVARSLLAAHHARRKAELSEKHKRERKLLHRSFGENPSYEQFLRAAGDNQHAEDWRYRNCQTEMGAITGDGNEEQGVRDIRDFEGRSQAHSDSRSLSVNYFKRSSPGQISFADHGRRIEVYQTNDQTAVLAALQLASQKWGVLTITGPAEFRHLCAELAAEHGFRIHNAELKQSPAVKVLPSQKADQRSSPEEAYKLHRSDILERIEITNPSQLDWMIAVRMRVTGHDQQSIRDAIRANVGDRAASERRDWDRYANRTAEAVFTTRGDREANSNQGREDRWLQVEGRPSGRDRIELQKSRSLDRKTRGKARRSFEIGD